MDLSQKGGATQKRLGTTGLTPLAATTTMRKRDHLVTRSNGCDIDFLGESCPAGLNGPRQAPDVKLSQVL